MMQEQLSGRATLCRAAQVPVGGHPGVVHAHVAGHSGRALLRLQLAHLQAGLRAQLPLDCLSSRAEEPSCAKNEWVQSRVGMGWCVSVSVCLKLIAGGLSCSTSAE